MNESKKAIHWELFSYFFVSLVCFSADFGTYWFFLEKIEMHYLLAALVGLLVGNLLNYTLSIRFVFETRKLEDRMRELMVFVTVGFCSLPIHHGVLYLCVEYFHLDPMLSKLFAAGSSFLAIFGFRKFLLF